MLSSLALRNAQRSFRDYAIYILTVTIIFSLLYAFNMIVFSEDIMNLASVMSSMVYAVVTVSIIIVVVTGWLVHYMNTFILQRRSKELGTYMLLGISNKDISKLFLIENIIIGGLSLIIGIVIGSLIYQVLVLIVMNIFEAYYEVKITFSLKALVLTIIYVFFIYIFSIIRNKTRLNKMKIYDLLYAEKKNETSMLKSIKGNWVILIISIITGVLGAIFLYLTFSDGENVTIGRIGVSFLCFVICIYGFYISSAFILRRMFIDNANIKYKKNNLFLFRNLSSKMNTMSITLGTLGLLCTLTLISVSAGMLFKSYFDNQLNSITNFDISLIDSTAKEDFDSYKNYIKDNFTIEQEKTYTVYESGNREIYDVLAKTSLGGSYLDFDYVMRLSDYKELRKMLGYKEVELKEGNFIVQCLPGVKKEIEKIKDFKISLGGELLSYQESFLEPFALEGTNGAYYVVIVSDEVAEKLNKFQSIYVINTKEQTRYKDREELIKYIPKIKSEDGIEYINARNVDVKGALLAESRSMYTILSFSLFYIGLIFICVASTILAVQQLSEAVKYKFRYDILKNIGMKKSLIEGTILKQLLVYFAFPLILPIAISIFVTTCIHQVFVAYVSGVVLINVLLTSIGLFLFVYVFYFICTYVGYRKSIFKS